MSGHCWHPSHRSERAGRDLIQNSSNHCPGLSCNCQQIDFGFAVIELEVTPLAVEPACGTRKRHRSIGAKILVLLKANVDDARITGGIVAGTRIGDQLNLFDVIARHIFQHIDYVLHGEVRLLAVDLNNHAIFSPQLQGVVLPVDRYAGAFSSTSRAVLPVAMMLPATLITIWLISCSTKGFLVTTVTSLSVLADSLRVMAGTSESSLLHQTVSFGLRYKPPPRLSACIVLV